MITQVTQYRSKHRQAKWILVAVESPLQISVPQTCFRHRTVQGDNHPADTFQSLGIQILVFERDLITQDA
jgi:hypothetical protein